MNLYFNVLMALVLAQLDRTQCWIDLGAPWRWQVYMSLVAASLFVLPAIIITACYAIIIRTIWAKGSMLVTTGECWKADFFYNLKRRVYIMSLCI